MPVASVDQIRTHFPALERREADRPVAYFDGPGGTQVPRCVPDAMADYLLRHNANTHWAYPSSAETDALLDGAREALAHFLGCGSGEVVFGANMTSLTYHLSRAVGRGLEPGDEVVVTRLDHQANVAPWVDLALDRGLVVRTVPFHAEDGRLDEDAYHEALSDRTRIVALGAASNALGTVTELGPLLARARERGAFTFVDAVHAAPHHLPDAAALGCDALACSPYKFYGPHLGVLHVRADRLASLDVPRLPCAGDAGGERLETGTLSHEAIVGAAAAVDFLADLWSDDPSGRAGGGAASTAAPTASAGEESPSPPTRRARLSIVFEALERRADDLATRLWTGLEAQESVVLYGPRPGTPRTSTLAFTVEGVPSEVVTRHLADHHAVFTSHGDFYASTVVDDLGLRPDGLVRAGAAIYTTADEVDRLVAGVADLAAGGRR